MTKATGIVRKLDSLGRIVLPIELRRTLGLAEGDGIEIFVDGENVILRKYQPMCVFCGHCDELQDFYGKKVCPECREEIGDRGHAREEMAG